jgi:hypothetical protein
MFGTVYRVPRAQIENWIGCSQRPAMTDLSRKWSVMAGCCEHYGSVKSGEVLVCERIPATHAQDACLEGALNQHARLRTQGVWVAGARSPAPSAGSQ